MSFSSIAAMLAAAQQAGRALPEIICEDDCRENGTTRDEAYRQMAALWEAMVQSSAQYRASDRSRSGLIG